MEAGSVRQSKAGHKTGPEAIAPENGKNYGDQVESNRAAEPVSASAPATSVSAPAARLHEERSTRLPGIFWLGWRAMAAVLGGLILRLWMFRAFPQLGGDVLIYGGIAKNILLHNRFAISDGSGVLHSTLIRLPGYPLFLAACFRVFGGANYNAVAWLQIAMELAACLLLADFVRRIASPRAGLNTLWFAAMCPFTAVYSSAPLTESPTFDMICLALWSLERYLSRRDLSNSARNVRWPWLLLFTLAISFAALLRPDGALLAFALWPALLFSRGSATPIGPALRRALLCGIVSVLPFALWAARNWHTFHVFEPLAPRYAGDPGEDPHLGWQHWVKTWCLDFTCTSDIYWNVPDGPAALEDLPPRAFDSEQQRQVTARLFVDYNRDQDLTPAIDARFQVLANQRLADHPLRSRVLLPFGRLLDMTLRPRVENLPIDERWWQYSQHRPETKFSIVYGVVNLCFLGLGLWGFRRRPRFWAYMAAYLVLRSLLLMTIEAPETRYTLEFFPVLFATGGIALQQIFARKKPGLADKRLEGYGL
jgi:hypothetical protein